MKTINSILGTIAILLIIGTGCQRNADNISLDQMIETAKATANATTVDQLKEKLDNGDMLLLLDVRESNEFNPGYIPGAVNIPRGLLEFKIDNEEFWDAAFLYVPEKDEEIVVYCHKGKRSILAAETLEKLGYTKVTYLDGGWKNWEMNYPLIYLKNLEQMNHSDSGESGGC